MTVIKVSSGSSEYTNLLLRQLPGMNHNWKDCDFFINSDVKECDWWFVLHGSGIVKTEECICDPDNIVYVSMEPNETLSKVSNKFINQFSKLVICDRSIIHPNITYMNWLTWWVGIVVTKNKNQHFFSKIHKFNYDDFIVMKPMNKVNKLSIVLSTKNFSSGHQKRINFLDKLINSHIAKYIDVYGEGFTPIPDKWDAIAKYKYHLVLENSVTKDYWSEKLADAFLGFSLPIYYGCPNINDYFSDDSMIHIDIEDFEGSIEIIKRTLESNIYEEKIEIIEAARSKVLNEYNIFNLISNMANSKAVKTKKIKLHTNYYYSDSFLKKIARFCIAKIKINKINSMNI
jgi:hypothetical protein